MASGGSEIFDVSSERVARRADMLKRAVALDFFTRVMVATPVDTGWARGSWHVTRDHIDLSVPPQPPARRAGQGAHIPPPSVDLAPSLDPDSILYVTNNVVYILALNNGHSKQAPAGYIDAALEATRTYYETLVAITVTRDGGL